MKPGIKPIIFLFLITLTVSFIIPCHGEINIPFMKKEIDYFKYVNKSFISGLQHIYTDGNSLCWNRENNLIVTEKEIFDGFFDLVVFKPSGLWEENINLKKKSAPIKHNGNPCWHPSGEWIVFTAQNKDALGYFNMKKGVPGVGLNCNLFLTDRDGERYWQLTYHSTSIYDTKAVIYPRFSRDGERLFWAERERDSETGKRGAWVLNIAEFEFEGEIPVLKNREKIRLSDNDCFYQSHDFNDDRTEILFSGNLEEGYKENGLDIYRYNLDTGELMNLTNSPDDWDGYAHYSPDGKKIIWVSSRNIQIKWGSTGGYSQPSYLKTDLWIMDVTGENKIRLTYFNNIPEKESVNKNFRVIVSDSTWSPAGDSVLATVVFINGGKTENKQILFKLKNEGK